MKKYILMTLLLLCGILVLLCRNVVVIEPVVLEENRCESLYAAVNLSGKGCGVYLLEGFELEIHLPVHILGKRGDYSLLCLA